MTSFSENAIRIMRDIPHGTVLTYGDVASMAGNPRGARQVARLLHSSSGKHNLPWHRVVGKGKRISLPKNGGFELQAKLLSEEGWFIKENGQLISG